MRCGLFFTCSVTFSFDPDESQTYSRPFSSSAATMGRGARSAPAASSMVNPCGSRNVCPFSLTWCVCAASGAAAASKAASARRYIRGPPGGERQYTRSPGERRGVSPPVILDRSPGERRGVSPPVILDHRRAHAPPLAKIRRLREPPRRRAPPTEIDAPLAHAKLLPSACHGLHLRKGGGRMGSHPVEPSPTDAQPAHRPTPDTDPTALREPDHG